MHEETFSRKSFFMVFFYLTIVFGQALPICIFVLRCFFALAPRGYVLPLCSGLACRSCRDGQLLLEEQK